MTISSNISMGIQKSDSGDKIVRPVASHEASMSVIKKLLSNLLHHVTQQCQITWRNHCQNHVMRRCQIMVVIAIAKSHVVDSAHFVHADSYDGVGSTIWYGLDMAWRSMRLSHAGPQNYKTTIESTHHSFSLEDAKTKA